MFANLGWCHYFLWAVYSYSKNLKTTAINSAKAVASAIEVELTTSSADCSLLATLAVIVFACWPALTFAYVSSSAFRSVLG